MKKKTSILILVILILLVIIGCLVMIKITPPSNQYKNYVISGKVLPSEKKIGDRPTYVYAFYPYYYLSHLCRSSEVQLIKIDWIDDDTGQFEIFFNVPIGLKEIILTTDCSSCNYSIKVDLNDITLSVDLIWGGEICWGSYQVSDQKTIVVSHTRNLLNAIETKLVDEPFNSSEKQNIREDIKKGREAIFDSELKMNYSESLLQAYYARWFSWSAVHKFMLFELKYCLEKINTLLQRNENDNCYVPDYTAYKDYSSANTTYFSQIEHRSLDDTPFDTKEIKMIKQEISGVHKDMELVLKANTKCDMSFRIINETFEFQKPYCEVRKSIKYTTYLIWAIVFVYIGILIENVKQWKK